jgi:hypothetical protein
LSIRTNVANHDNQIEQFLAWIKPYIILGSGESGIYAFVINEKNYVPEIYCLNYDRSEANPVIINSVEKWDMTMPELK